MSLNSKCVSVGSTTHNVAMVAGSSNKPDFVQLSNHAQL